MRYKLRAPTVLIDWSAPRYPRPSIRCRRGTTVRIHSERLPDGTYAYTAYIRRRGRVWSNSRHAASGKLYPNFRSQHYHTVVSQL
jgi:hypothetical protein